MHQVLIVDDDAFVRRMLWDSFAERGFNVRTAADATRGLQRLLDDLLTLDALVTDVYMPGVDGEAFVRTIRGAGGERDLPIIVATASVDDELKVRLRSAGANRVLDKAGGPGPIIDATLDELGSRTPPATLIPSPESQLCLATTWDHEGLRELARAELARLGPDAPLSLREVLEGILDPDDLQSVVRRRK